MVEAIITLLPTPYSLPRPITYLPVCLPTYLPARVLHSSMYLPTRMVLVLFCKPLGNIDYDSQGPISPYSEHILRTMYVLSPGILGRRHAPG